MIFALFLASAHASDVTLLPDRPLYAPLLSNTSSPYWGLRASAGPNIQAALGQEFQFCQFTVGDSVMQFGLSAGAFLGMQLDGPLTFPVQTLDGVISAPMDWSQRRLRIRTAWKHLSGHYADGVRHLDKLPTNHEGLSRELWETDIQWLYSDMRLSGGVSWMIKSLVHNKGASLRLGADWESADRHGPHAALEYTGQSWTEWTPGFVMQLGYSWIAESQRLRLGLRGYSGPNEVSKLEEQDDRYLAFQFSYHPRIPETQK